MMRGTGVSSSEADGGHLHAPSPGQLLETPQRGIPT